MTDKIKVDLPPIDKVNKITIVGIGGTMGSGWGALALARGFDVYGWEKDESRRNGIIDNIRGRFITMGKRKLLPENFDQQEALKRLILLPSEDGLYTSGAQILLEVIPENLQYKQEFFASVGPKLPPEVILWSNTSCLKVEKLARASGRAQQLVATHGMNPPELLNVEVVQHELLDEEVLNWTIEVLKKMGKDPFVAQDVAGFIVNKVFVPYALDCLGILFRKEADVATLDKAIRDSLSHPQGILKLQDLIGLDVMVLVADELYQATQDPRLVVPWQLRKMVENKSLGFKTAKGFYDWSGGYKDIKPRTLEDMLAA